MDVYVLCTNDCVCNACLSEFQSWASLVTFAIEKGFAGRSADVTRLMSRSLAVPGATWKNASLLIFPPLVASQDPKVPALFRRGDQGHSAGRPSPLQRGRVTIGHSIPPSAVGVMHARRARPPHSAYPLFFQRQILSQLRSFPVCCQVFSFLRCGRRRLHVLYSLQERCALIFVISSLSDFSP